MANFTEFCCRAGGSNLNAGTRTGSSTEPGLTADLTYTGSWNTSTKIFTVDSGNPVADGVVAGDYGAIDVGAASLIAGYGGRLQTVTSTTFFFDSLKVWGTNPGTGSYTMRIGGAWLGPAGSRTFPLLANVPNATNANNDPVRLNMKNDQAYAMTSLFNTTGANVGILHGYQTTYGDGGRATFSAPTTGASFVLFTSNSTTQPIWLDSLIFTNNGATGNSAGVVFGAANPFIMISRCVFTGMCGTGLSLAGTATLVECEIYGNNTSNTSGSNGLTTSGATTVIRCVIHDNVGSNNRGVLVFSGTIRMIDCIVESNGSHGLELTGFFGDIINCDFYNNTGNGINNNTSVNTMIFVENSNFLKNGGWGIGGTFLFGSIRNCGFGSGGQANASGEIQSGRFSETNRITYGGGVAPWVDADNGDFRVNIADAQSTGRGMFTETAPSYYGTFAYPDVGAGQHSSPPAPPIPPNPPAPPGPSYFAY